MNIQNSDENAFFGEVIYAYTRAQAISDGMLVDVTQTAREAGFKHPTAVTAALWQTIEHIPEEFSHEDIQGRLWDVLFMAALNARRVPAGCNQFPYTLILHQAFTDRQEVELICHCGPGDRGEPVLTIGFPEDF
jgi:hypothetical protein